MGGSSLVVGKEVRPGSRAGANRPITLLDQFRRDQVISTRCEGPLTTPGAGTKCCADNGLSQGELLRKDDYLKSGDSGVGF
jgi:hypothetical protein